MKSSRSPWKSFAILVLGLALGTGIGVFVGPKVIPGSRSIADTSASSAAAPKPAAEAGNDVKASSEPVAPEETASQDLGDRVREIFRERVETERYEKFWNLVQGIELSQYPEMVALVRESDLQGIDAGGEWSRMWTSWGRRDPVAAMEFLRTNTWAGWDSLAITEARDRALTAWTEVDAESARKFVDESPEIASGDRSYVYGLVRGWANVDPDATVAWLAKTGLGMRGEFKMVVAAVYRKGGQEGINQWFAKINQSDLPVSDKAGYALEIEKVKEEYQPAETAAWVVPYLSENWMQGSEIPRRVIQAYAKKDPVAALEWTEQHQPNLTYLAVDYWCQNDIGSAIMWFDKHGDELKSANMANIICLNLVKKDPIGAKNWIESLPDETMRTDLMRLVPKSILKSPATR
ncbi:hypothetical protein JIN85_01885 [Luteolibacter pohnpeiensis]|uniref:DUF4034 domain-containing protein n=1 Tax=Luteolibacter pohnpeiensis TaxID=454153 RepID=A0A934S3C3_9BACT|nr:hypothetical protein [Luteolibacter pohnpeiensis]MBK1881143.1 hypothetical protein [Luteolibacter pohnpeiensis]